MQYEYAIYKCALQQFTHHAEEDEQQSKTRDVPIIFTSVMEDDRLTAKQRCAGELNEKVNKGE